MGLDFAVESARLTISEIVHQPIEEDVRGIARLADVQTVGRGWSYVPPFIYHLSIDVQAIDAAIVDIGQVIPLARGIVERLTAR